MLEAPVEIGSSARPLPSSASKNRLSRPATKMLPYAEYGPAVLGFAFREKELDRLALDRDPDYRALKESKSFDEATLFEMFSTHSLMVARLCDEISSVWPNAYVCYVRLPNHSSTEYAVALADNTHPKHSKLPTVEQVIKIRQLLGCPERKAAWYADDNEE